MSRLSIALCLTPVTLFVAFFLYASWIEMSGNPPSMPDVVACLDTPNPAKSVEITSNRRGRVVDRNVFGCAVYWYEGPRWD